MSLAGKTIQIGVVLFPHYQLLDLAGPIDYLNNHTPSWLSVVLPPGSPLLTRAATIQWSYISETLDPVRATSGPSQTPTHTFANPPKNLDYLLIPGPEPSIQLSTICIDFFKTVMPNLKGLLTVCTGSIAVAQTGILDGYQVCSNKFCLRQLAQEKKLRKEVTWIGDRRWNVDGKVWSAAGITAGIDLAAEFARVHFDAEIVEVVKAGSEETPKPARPDEWAHLLDGVDLN